MIFDFLYTCRLTGIGRGTWLLRLQPADDSCVQSYAMIYDAVDIPITMICALGSAFSVDLVTPTLWRTLLYCQQRFDVNK